MSASYDVIVVGGGGSGLAAAVSATEQGCRVALLEKRPQLGGTTGMAVGSFTASATRYQVRAGITDTSAAHAEDAALFAPSEIEARNNDALRRLSLNNSAATLDWLAEMGLKFHGPNPEPPNRVPRMHNVVPGAKAYIAALQAKLLQLGGEIHCTAQVSRLIRSNDRVIGVGVNVDGEKTTMMADCGVILAAGDYANSPELIARFQGDRFSDVEGINPHATGDGHRLAESVGARLVNMDITYGPEIRFVAPPGRTFQQLLPTRGPLPKMMTFVPNFVVRRLIKRLLVTWQHPENALLEEGALLINVEGRRFCDERQSPDREIAIAKQTKKIAYLLLDGRLIERYSQWPHFISTAPQIAYAYVSDYLRLRPDVAIAADALPELARRRGIPPESLVQTINDYNADPPDGVRLGGDRWCLLGPAKSYFTTTEGGAMINENFQVMDHDDRPIRGLYAIGQNGLGGQVLWGHGLHIAWAMTSGRLAGCALARTKDNGVVDAC